MRKLLYILFILLSIGLNQDRSTIFNTGSPDSTNEGYLIDSNNTIANRFVVNNSYVLEAMVFYMSAETIELSNVIVSIREDNNGVPGEITKKLQENYFNLVSGNNKKHMEWLTTLKKFDD